MDTIEARRRLGLGPSATETEIANAHARLTMLTRKSREDLVAKLDEAAKTLLSALAASDSESHTTRPFNGASVVWWFTIGGLREALAHAIKAHPELRQTIFFAIDSSDVLTDADRRELKDWLGTPKGFWTILGRRAAGLLELIARLGPLWLIGLAYAGGLVWAPTRAGRDYFVAAAGVIPVLLLALAIETRLLRLAWLVRFKPVRTLPLAVYGLLSRMAENANDRDMARAVKLWKRMDTTRAFYRELMKAARVGGTSAIVLGALALSEWHCMATLASLTDNARASPALVSGGILAGLVGIGVVALFGGTTD